MIIGNSENFTRRQIVMRVTHDKCGSMKMSAKKQHLALTFVVKDNH